VRHAIAASLAVVLFALSACSSKGTESRATGSGSNAGSGGSAVPGPPAPAADERFNSSSLGSLTFYLTEGNPPAREHFQRGMLALHSFWYDEAKRQFGAAIMADRSMNLAYWGLAMSNLELLWGRDDLDLAKSALGQMPDPDRLSEREQAWVVAAIALLKAPDVRSSRIAFARAMEELNARFPDDESATFLAVALLSTLRPEDPNSAAIRERAASLAKTVFDHNPKHPGAAHYLVHAYDTPELAARALPMATQYAAIAPAAPHARHMPAHIFSRLGMWTDAITSCIAAWDASLAAAKREKLSQSFHDFHSLHWLVEMPFELGKKSDADRWLGVFAAAVKDGLDPQYRGLYATEVASYLQRTGEWTRVDELLEPLSAPPVPIDGAPKTAGSGAHCGTTPLPTDDGERMAVLDTRALAAAMHRDVAATRRYIGEIDAVRTKLRPTIAAMQSKEALGELDKQHERRKQELLARAVGDDRALVKILRVSPAGAAAAAGGESNPSAFIADEQIADALFRLGQLEEAANAYALVLRQHPKRAHSLLGAARTATKRKDATAARAFYSELAELWANADATTDGLADAKAAIAAP
jgi:tetratricopeptide (TPR) repeat protein